MQKMLFMPEVYSQLGLAGGENFRVALKQLKRHGIAIFSLAAFHAT